MPRPKKIVTPPSPSHLILGHDDIKKHLDVAVDLNMPVLLVGDTGCFAKGTPVLTVDGYRPIETLRVGDRVATFDGKLVDFNRLEFVQETVNKPKPMLEFTYGKDTIRATYDHPFYNGEKYYPLYQLAWRDMEESERVQLKLLCEQYGTAFDRETVRGITHGDNETWEGQIGASPHSYERANSQGTSSSGSNMAVKSDKSTVYQSQEQQPRRQSSGQLGVVYSEAELTARLQDGSAQQVPKESTIGNDQVQQKTDLQDSELVGLEYYFGPEDRQGDKAPIIHKIAKTIPIHPSNHTKKYKTQARGISAVKVREAEPYYALGVANVHTYIVGTEQLPVHNSGKTTIVKELADKHGKQWIRFNLTGETTVDEFVGKYTLADKKTVWEDGVLLSAMKKGYWLIVDEVNVALPEILFVLHSLLDDERAVMVAQHEGEVVKPHPDFRFFGTMNPIDEYAGTKDLNKAFKSRFGMILNMGYPKAAIETKVLTTKTGVNSADASRMVDVGVRIRKAKEDGQVFYTCSTRDLIQWATLTQTGKMTVLTAFEVSILNKANGDRDKVGDIYNAVIGDYKKAEAAGLQTNLEYYQAKQEELGKEKELFDKQRSEIEDQIKKELIEHLVGGGSSKKEIPGTVEPSRPVTPEPENFIVSF